jgi:hypothetical protein
MASDRHLVDVLLIGLPLAGAVQAKLRQFMCLSDCDLLIGEGGFQEDSATIEDRFAEQDARRYSAWSSVVVIVGVVVVLGLLYFVFR